MIYIYGLIDPFTFKIRYIGKSIRPKERLMNELNEKSKCYRSNWLQSLKKKGKKPFQVILQELNETDDWQKAERRWIYVARKYGWKLVNTTDGGDGVLNICGESKERMLRTWKGRKHRSESLLKLSIANKGVPHPESAKDKLSIIMAHRSITWKDKLQIANRKFTDEQIKEIQERLNKKEKVKDLATEFNVHRTTITKIKLGTYKTFKQKTYNYVKPRRYHKSA